VDCADPTVRPVRVHVRDRRAKGTEELSTTARVTIGTRPAIPQEEDAPYAAKDAIPPPMRTSPNRRAAIGDAAASSALGGDDHARRNRRRGFLTRPRAEREASHNLHPVATDDVLQSGLSIQSAHRESQERYAVVSCHVERPLDDAVWARFSALQEHRPGGFAIAALMRPVDSSASEDESLWIERAREAAARGPIGHHTHWTAPDHARPTNGDTGSRVRTEAVRLEELGLAPTLFCGGGWYTDADVAGVCAELGYVDCTFRAVRPAYLAQGECWASLSSPARVQLPSGRLLRAIPTTHSLGDVARALLRRQRLPGVVHVYFHDTDLLYRRRRAMIQTLLPLLARRARATDLDALTASALDDAPVVTWDDVARL
jgi:hypothetical protein